MSTVDQGELGITMSIGSVCLVQVTRIPATHQDMVRENNEFCHRETLTVCLNEVLV